MTKFQRLRFLRRFVANPSVVASPIPTGKRLAAAIAAQIDADASGPVLELGPGTGAVTAEILRRGVKQSELIAVESDKQFSAFLKETYPEARIVLGDALRFPATLAQLEMNSRLRAIISGVPVLDKPIAVRQRYLISAIRHLQNGAPFVQFSYGAVPPIPPVDGVQVKRAAFAWWNIPPLHVWVYRKSPANLDV